MALNLKTLVLEADHKPLSFSRLPLEPWRKVISDVMEGRLIMLESWDVEARSPSVSCEIPAVVARIKYNPSISLRFKTPAPTRIGILTRDRLRCCYCGPSIVYPMDELSIDHIDPKCRGGADTWMNMISSCLPHNQSKGSLDPKRYRLKRTFEPYVPTGAQLGSIARDLQIGKLDERQARWLRAA
jgi:5-methylcytosine-specific restriction endonuclease McrA